MNRVILKPEREKSLLRRHPWIFSGAIHSFPDFEQGDVLSVYSHQEEFLAKAYFHKSGSISGRVLTFHDESIEQAILQRLKEAQLFRRSLFCEKETNCYRLINAEGDGLSGLIIDIYDRVAVIQISTWGMERYRELILSFLQTQVGVRGVFEKSSSNARRQEGLEDRIGPLFGECLSEVLVRENGIKLLIPIHEGQKTGFFLDQREMRLLTQQLSAHRSVLNCFAYTGGFSLFAFKGGAKRVVSVDGSRIACDYAKKNTQLNNLSQDKHQVICEDVFSFLHESTEEFDFVILDPPAFAKKRSDVNQACRGYQEINAKALQKMPPHSYLLTSSCSHFIDEKLFQQVVFQAALQANKQVSICSSHIAALDHPVSLFHPEGKYLKSLLLYVR